MKSAFTLIAMAGMSAAALTQGVPASTEPCLHIRNAFSLVVNASYEATAPLFGPLGERGWLGEEWNPILVYPQPAKDVEGSVFTVSRGLYHSVWVNTLFDTDQRHFQYVYFVPDRMMTVVDVRFKPTGANSTRVDVVFTRTAITAKGNELVTEVSESDKSAAERWRLKIDNYLAGVKN
ncbi:MAG: hypothetical protein ACLPXT_15310 [Terracidiphilus sp.]